MRAFVAITIPPAIRAALADEAAGLAAHTRHVRTATPDNLHLTLAFLGQVPAQRIDSLRSAMQAAAAGRRPFSIGFDSGGAFPTRGEPRVAWAGVDGELGALRDVQAAVTEAMRGIGLRVDQRPFSPHVTLARIGRQATPWARTAIVRSLETMELDRQGRFTVKGISLIESDLTSDGAVHREVFTVDFTPAEPPQRRFGFF